MKRITLFSTLTDRNEQAILNQILPPEISTKTLAYIPSGGVQGAQDYIDQWEDIAHRYDAKFNVINNRLNSIEEQAKLLTSNILVISGGNTFDLLYNLRRSGLDKSIKKFLNKPNFVLSGLSAGALVLTPHIKICNLPNFDENLVGLEDMTGLGVVDFEVFPHYDNLLHRNMLSNYQKTASNLVREIADEEYISIDL